MSLDLPGGVRNCFISCGYQEYEVGWYQTQLPGEAGAWSPLETTLLSPGETLRSDPIVFAVAQPRAILK